MALLKAVTLGAMAGIGLPYVARDYPGLWGGLFEVGVIQPLAKVPGLHISIPILATVAIFAWGLFVWAEK